MNIVPISRDDERLEAASRWIVKLDEGLSAGEEAALQGWLTEHPRNPTELIEVARAWDKLDSLSRLADVFPIEQAGPRREPRLWPRRPGRAAGIGLAAAASVLILAAAVWLSVPLQYSGEPAGDGPAARKADMYETGIGEQRMLTLADGTVLNVNTDSRVSVDYSASARVLRLVRGEIHVDVVPDPARPLSVIAGDRIVQAVGTAFGVEITADRQLDLVVAEGKVRVGRHPGGTPDDREAAAVRQPVRAARLVSAGQALIVRAADETLMPVSPGDIEAKLSWREGRLIFRDEPLEQAIAEIERYTTVEFVLLDDALKTQSISGRYKTGDVEALLLALRANFDIAYEYAGENRVLLRSL